MFPTPYLPGDPQLCQYILCRYSSIKLTIASYCLTPVQILVWLNSYLICAFT